MKLFKAMATVAGLTGISRILGFLRDILTAAILGAGPIADAFFVALKLPNFFRRVTAEGAFSVAFVPLYSEKLEKEGDEKADLFASNAFAVMLTVLIPFTLIALLSMPFIIYAIAPGFSGDEVRYDLAVDLSRITFPYLLFMSLTALLGGVLNAHDRFAPFASAPILFNLCLIIALWFGAPISETPGHALAYGIAAAGVAQCLWLFVCIRKANRRIVFKRPELTPNIKKLFKLMGPGVIGAGVMHINLFADLIIASLLTSGSISYLYYADRLNQLPLGMVGIAVGTALLPMLSKALAAKNDEEVQKLFNRSLEICLLLALPAAAALFVIPEALIGGLFERGAFTGEDTIIAAKVLMGYAIGLPAYVAVKVFSTVYWSHQDTASPVKISIVTTLMNIALSLILIWPLGVAGIALSTGLMGWVQLMLLYRGLKKKSSVRFDDRFKNVALKLIVSTFVMVMVLIAANAWINLPPIPFLIVLVLAGMVSYAGAALGTKAVRISDIKTYMRKTP